MTRACAWCGHTFEAKRPTAKFCSSNCRAKSSNASKRAPRPAPAEVPPVPLPVASGLVAAVRAELEAAERDATALGAQALALAARIDTGADTGSAIAALSKELRAVMDSALAGAAKAADKLDELSERRKRKASGA